MLQSKKTVYDMAGNTAAVKSVGQLRNRAGAAVGKPFPRSCPVIRDPGRGLQIQYNHGRLAYLMNGEDGGAVDISARMGKNQIHIFGIEKFPAAFPCFFAVCKPVKKDLCVHFSYFFSNELSIMQKPFPQSRKLVPVSLQPHGINADARLFRCVPFFHKKSLPFIKIIVFWRLPASFGTGDGKALKR